jgi:hypothetical protein
LGEKATTAAVDLKAPKESPIFTGTATAAALTVNGALLIGTTNVSTALTEKATNTNLDLKAPKESPALTGTATANNLTVNGALLIGTTNVGTALGEKATTSQLEALRTNTTLSGAITINTGGSLRVNTIEAISPIPAIYMHSGLKITSAYGLEVDEIASNSSANLTIVSNCVVGTASTAKNLTVKGLTTTENLTVPGYATVSGLLTTGQTVLCNDLEQWNGGCKNIEK